MITTGSTGLSAPEPLLTALRKAAWSSLIAVAGFARVPVFQIVRTAMVPVLTGLAVSTVCAVLIWH